MIQQAEDGLPIYTFLFISSQRIPQMNRNTNEVTNALPSTQKLSYP